MFLMFFLIGGLGIGKIMVIKGIVEFYVEFYGCLLNLGDYKKDEVFFVLFVVFIGCVVK